MTYRLKRLVDHSRYAALALLFTAVVAGASGSARAQGTAIVILDEHYSIKNSVTTRDPPCFSSRCFPTSIATTTTQQTNSITPLERELVVGPATYDWAKGAADTFSVSAVANGWSRATAETSLSFRVLQDTTTLLTFGGSATTWAWGVFSLFDQTTGDNLYSQNFSTSYPGFSPQGVAPSAASFSGSFDSDHIYKMTIRGDADAQYDGIWGMSLSVAGLNRIATPVPEPEAYAMGMIGFGVLWLMMRRRKSWATAWVYAKPDVQSAARKGPA